MASGEAIGSSQNEFELRAEAASSWWATGKCVCLKEFSEKPPFWAKLNIWAFGISVRKCCGWIILHSFPLIGHQFMISHGRGFNSWSFDVRARIISISCRFFVCFLITKLDYTDKLGIRTPFYHKPQKTMWASTTYGRNNSRFICLLSILYSCDCVLAKISKTNNNRNFLPKSQSG